MRFEFKLVRLLSAACLSVLLANIVYADNNQNNKNCFPYIPGLPNQQSMTAPNKVTNPKTTTYILPATPATTQWGVFDSSQEPVLKIKSGDSVAIETMAASDNQVVPGTTINHIVEMNNAIATRGPHTITGPIYVEGAEPGDVLKIHFNKIVPRPYASNDNVPGKGLFRKGLFSKEIPENYVKYYYLDLKKMQMTFAPGIVVPLAPFPGLIAVARQEDGKFDTAPPGPFGGNMDLREMTEGTTIYLPVFKKGALLWTGDSHAGQGNGEIDLTAIETAFEEFNITVDVIKQNKPLAWPRVETKNAWIAVGYEKDLNKAFDILKNETVKLIAEKRNVSPQQAKTIMMETWNCPIAEVVNGVQGVYCMVPKSGMTKYVLPQADNAKYFVTKAKDADVEEAMKIASRDMLNKMVNIKKMDLKDAYTLASFAMDCRIAPHTSGDKEVVCMLPKNLWVS